MMLYLFDHVLNFAFVSILCLFDHGYDALISLSVSFAYSFSFGKPFILWMVVFDAQSLYVDFRSVYTCRDLY